MSTTADAALRRGDHRHTIEVADETLVFRSVEIPDLTPTGMQLAKAAGFKPPDAAIVLQMLGEGSLETIRPDEVVDLRQDEGRFIIVKNDRIYLFSLNGERFEWPARVVSGAVLRKLGNVPRDETLYLERIDHPDRAIDDQHLVDLDRADIESFLSRKQSWKLNVHGVVIEVATSTVTAKAAMDQAGFDTAKPWHIYFKVAGAPKREVELETILDLETPGIEKLRLSPRDVGNGEAPPAPRRDFALLDADTDYLDRLKLRWETVEEDDQRRWLVILHYPVLPGYTVPHTLLALEVPPPYPAAQIYGFYAYPPLKLASGREIPSTQMRGTIRGKEFHGWSRNRGAVAWNPAIDNVVTQLALVEAALAKEVGE